MENPEVTVPFVYAMAFFLSAICALHYFWWVLLSKVLGKYITKGVAQDPIQKGPSDEKEKAN